MQNRFTERRREELSRLVLATGFVSVKDAAKQLGVSAETIRKDLIALEGEGRIRRSHGGAALPDNLADIPITQKRLSNVARKDRIARAVLKHIPEHASIILDAGSTAYAVAKLLAARSGCTIFANSPDSVTALSGSENNVYAMGGKLRHESGAIVGAWANSIIESIQAEIAILGVDGCASPSGPAINGYEEVLLKRNMVSAAKQIILLADSSKLSKPAAFQFCSWNEIKLFITDDDASPEEIETLRTLVPVEIAS